MMDEAIRKAQETESKIVTTYAAFTGFDDLYDFLKKASDSNVEVVFAPYGDE